MNFEGNNVEIFELNGQVLFNPKHVAEILEISDVKSSIRNFDKSQIIKIKNSDVHEQNFRKINNAGENFLTKNGLLKLISQCRNVQEDKKIRLLKFLFPDKEIIVINTPREINFLDKLEEVLEELNIKGIRQYMVDNYRIDLYLPNMNIAIEYDENEHSAYEFKDHEFRENIIKEKINCHFIRVSDKFSDLHNIGFVIKNILKLRPLV